MYSSKNVSWVYLDKYFWAENGIFGNLFAKTYAKPPNSSPFSYISGGLEGLFDFYDLLHHHPRTRHSPRQQLAHQAALEPPTRPLALSKCRSRASNYSRGMTQSLPLSYWSPEKSYMTSCRMAMLIYIAAPFRVKVVKVLSRPLGSRKG